MRRLLMVFALCTGGCDFAVRPLETLETGDLGSRADLASSNDLTGQPPDDLTGQPPDDLAVSDGPLPMPDLFTIPGVLSGSRTSFSGSVDLTAEGTVDWVHWGLVAPTDINRKLASTGNAITGALGTVTHYGSYNTSYSWSDGTPTATQPGSTTGVYKGGVGQSFIFTVPASTTTRTLRLYLLIYRGTSQITAHLSDSSAADYTETVANNGGAEHLRYTLVHHAGKPGQTLTVTFAMTADAGGGEATIDVLAASYF